MTDLVQRAFGVPSGTTIVELGARRAGSSVVSPALSSPTHKVLRNVTSARMHLFLPPAHMLGPRPAIVVAPGGGFRWLSMDYEGFDVATFLAARGFVVGVLEYRLESTPATEDDFQRHAIQFAAELFDPAKCAVRTEAEAFWLETDPELNPAIRDGVAAFRHLFEHAGSLNIDPRRIGFLGFSAGATVACGATQSLRGSAAPSFLAMIYMGSRSTQDWREFPPIFLAAARDDHLVLPSLQVATAGLIDAKASFEMHLYRSGGHGFGLKPNNSAAEKWPRHFLAWLLELGVSASASA